MKKIWLLCLCLASLGLVGCFHIPDEDWLPSKNWAETWNIQKNEDVEQAIDSLMEGVSTFSSQRNDMKNEENDVIDSGELEEANTIIEDENLLIEDSIDNWDIIDEKNENQEINENIVSEEWI